MDNYNRSDFSGPEGSYLVATWDAESYSWNFRPVMGGALLVNDELSALGLPVREERGLLHSVVAYAQQDSRWKNERMGGVAQTVGGYGCAMICALMVYTQIDNQLKPHDFNAMLSANGGYNLIYGNEAHLAWERLPQIYPRFKWEGRKDWSRLLDSSELGNIFAMIDEAPLVLWVDFKPLVGGMQSHFVLAVGHTADDIDIIDPWEGVRAHLMERYGRAANDTLRRAIWGYRRIVVR